MSDDVIASIRSLRSTAGFTISALIVLALGIGATTAIFSVVDAVVLRGLPFDEHDRLVAVGQRSSASDRRSAARDPEAISLVAPQNYLDWAAGQLVFESMAAFGSGWLTQREPGREPESLVPQRVTAGFFTVLRVAPAMGRTFTMENEVAGGDRVAVISDGLWRRRFGADPQIIGRAIPLEDLEGGQSASDSGGYEVIGIMPPGFTYPVGAARATDVWVPYVVPADQRIRDPRKYASYLQVIARLNPGVSLRQAQSQMLQLAAGIERANPVWNKDSTIGVRPLIDHIVGARIKAWMLMLLAAVGIVLLITCANIASLLLARASAREREVAVRAALGASRWRLIRRFMIESLVLAAAGTVCAIVVAAWAVEVLRAAMPDSVPRVAGVALDLRVLGAAAGLALVTGLLFGVVPAVQASRPNLSNALKNGARTGATARQHLRSALVVAEVALAVVLLVGAALFIGSFVSVMRIDPGFSADHVLTAQISPRIESRTRPRDFAPALSDIVDRISRIPGVTHASMISGGRPLSGYVTTTSISIPGKDFTQLNAGGGIVVRRVTADYHAALKIPLRRGRLFSAHDRKSAPLVVILNESAVTKYFGGEDPIGRTVSIDDDRTVVGVVGDVRHASLEVNPNAAAYVPVAQGEVAGAELIVRTSSEPDAVLPAVKAAVFAVMPDVPVRNARALADLLAAQLAQRRLNMLLLGLFGLLGLVIAAVGLYGLMAFLVAQRTREIGVRIALGASRSSVVAMVLVRASMLVGSGLVAGALAAWYLSTASRAFLFGLEPTDPRAFAGAAAALLLAALIASAIPARRAASVDPVTALRVE